MWARSRYRYNSLEKIFAQLLQPERHPVFPAERDPGLWPGVNVAGGEVTHRAVADGVGAEFVEPSLALGLEPLPQI